jgi:hypothetical protein
MVGSRSLASRACRLDRASSASAAADPGQFQYRLVQRPGHRLQHRGPGQEQPLPLRDPRQELGLHVLADQPVITTEGDRRRPERAALSQVQRRQVQPDPGDPAGT